MAKTHKIGGRTFVQASDTTLEQDFTFTALLKDAGLDEVTIEAGEDPEAVGRRVLMAAIANGAAFKMLGCILVPEALVPKRTRFTFGRRDSPSAGWTPDVGEDTAAFMARLSDPREKAKVRGLVLSLILSFFSSGTAFFWTTPTSSDETVPAMEEEIPAPAPNATVPGAPSS